LLFLLDSASSGCATPEAPLVPLIKEAARSLEQDLIALGDRFLDEERFARLRGEIGSFAREHETGNGFAVAQVEESLIESAEWPLLQLEETLRRAQSLDRLLRELTDHLISRLLFLTASLLALALLYRFLAARIVSRSKG